jgi:hypothetical protein
VGMVPLHFFPGLHVRLLPLRELSFLALSWSILRLIQWSIRNLHITP